MRSRLLWSLASICSAWLILSPACKALAPEYSEPFEFWLRQGVRANYEYVWGASDPTELTYDTQKKQKRRGLDCSGYVYWAARKAAIPGVRRVASLDMAHGLDGWVGRDYPGSKPDEWLRDADETDLVFFTFKDDRPYGHVGVLLRNAAGTPGVAHASGSRGVVLDEIKGWVLRDMVKVRRLTIGDKK